MRRSPAIFGHSHPHNPAPTRTTRPGPENTGSSPAFVQYSLGSQPHARTRDEARGSLVRIRSRLWDERAILCVLNAPGVAGTISRSGSCDDAEPRGLRWRGTPDVESGGRRFDSGRGDMPTWCNPASIRSCHGRDPGSNPGVGVQPSGARLGSEDKQRESSGVPGRGSRPGARRTRSDGVDAWTNHMGILIEVGSPSVRSSGSLPRCWAQQGLQPTRAGAVFPGEPEVRPRDVTRNHNYSVVLAQLVPVVQLDNQLPERSAVHVSRWTSGRLSVPRADRTEVRILVGSLAVSGER